MGSPDVNCCMCRSSDSLYVIVLTKTNIFTLVMVPTAREFRTVVCVHFAETRLDAQEMLVSTARPALGHRGIILRNGGSNRSFFCAGHLRNHCLTVERASSMAGSLKHVYIA